MYAKEHILSRLKLLNFMQIQYFVDGFVSLDSVSNCVYQFMLS